MQTLKLTGIESFISPLLFGVLVSRGDIIRVTDEVAGKIGGSKRLSSENEPIFYFSQVKGEHTVTHDFTVAAVAQAVAAGVPSDKLREAAALPVTRVAEAPRVENPVEDAGRDPGVISDSGSFDPSNTVDGAGGETDDDGDDEGDGEEELDETPPPAPPAPPAPPVEKAAVTEEAAKPAAKATAKEAKAKTSAAPVQRKRTTK